MIICEIEDCSNVNDINNTHYIKFPYIMYKINNMLPISNEVLKTFEDKLYTKTFDCLDNQQTETISYLVFKYIFDIDYLSSDAFEINEIINYSIAEKYLGIEYQQQIKKLSIPNDNLIFLKV